MFKLKTYFCLIFFAIAVLFTACLPRIKSKNVNKSIPSTYANKSPDDTTNTAKMVWKDFFKDTNLSALIDTALKNNQALNIVFQDVNIVKNQIKARKGQYLPFLSLFAAVGLDKQGEYTRLGAIDATNDIKTGTKTPSPLPDYLIGINASWQVDIWKQLRNAKKIAFFKYLASIEGKNFMVTLLVSDIASDYYQLMALDNQLEILKAYIDIQQNALNIVIQQKKAGITTELAVRRFEAEVAKNQSRLFYVQQKIVESENRINFILGRYPRPIIRSSKSFNELESNSMQIGVPSQLLQNRTDIKQAEQALIASNLDIKVAKANFYPVFNINANLGYQAFNPAFLIHTPQSALYNLAGGLMAPLINRNAIKAEYNSANARQIQVAFQYERTVLNAYIEVANQLSNMANLKKSYDFKAQQVQALTLSINISISLFKSALADYMEVLFTQRDALESKMELVETKKQQMHAKVKMYQVLGGGWKN